MNFEFSLNFVKLVFNNMIPSTQQIKITKRIVVSQEENFIDLSNKKENLYEKLDSQFLQNVLCSKNNEDNEVLNEENIGIAYGTWRQFEDEQLQEAIKNLGLNKWTECTKFVPTRTAKQCRDRWCNRLSPNLKKGQFEEWEDAIIIQKHQLLGNKWSKIASLLPGRSPNDVKNRWYSRLFSDIMRPY